MEQQKDLRIAIIVGSAHPDRKAKAVGDWVLQEAQGRCHVSYSVVDLKDVDLPSAEVATLLGPAVLQTPRTKAWSERIEAFDGFILVVPEEGEGAALKNAMRFLHQEWSDKPVAFVSYGNKSGLAAVEELRELVAELQMAPIRAQLPLSIAQDFKGGSEFSPRTMMMKKLPTLFQNVERWTKVLRQLRDDQQREAA